MFWVMMSLTSSKILIENCKTGHLHFCIYVGKTMVQYSSLFFHQSELGSDIACRLEQRAVNAHTKFKFKIKMFISTENF